MMVVLVNTILLLLLLVLIHGTYKVEMTINSDRILPLVVETKCGKLMMRSRQVYTNLSKAIFGYRVHMNTGYAYDQGYRNYYGKWHAGIDMVRLLALLLKQ